MIDTLTKQHEQIDLFKRQGKFQELIEFLKGEISKSASNRDRDELDYQLAEAYYEIREFKVAKALAEKIIIKIQKQKNHSLEGNAENLLGKIYRIYQHYDAALKHYHKAEKLFLLAKDSEGLSKINHNIGNTFVFLNQFKKAKKHHLKALGLAKQMGKIDSEANSYLNIGSMHFQQGEVDPALVNFERAKDLFKQIQEVPSLAATYLNISEVFLLRKDFTQSQSNSAQAIDLYAKQQSVTGQKLALESYARAAKVEGSHQKAIDTYKKILKLDQENIKEETLLDLGESYMSINQLIDAKLIFNQIFESTDYSLRGVGYSLNHLAQIAIIDQDFKSALDNYKKLLEILEKITPKDLSSVASTFGNLGLMYLKSNNIEEAKNYFNQAIEYFKKNKIWDEIIVLGLNYRAEFLLRKKYDNALVIIQDHLLPTVKKMRDLNSENQYIYEIAFIYHLKGETKKGLHYWQKHHIKKERIFKDLGFPISQTVNDPSIKELLNKYEEFLHFFKKVV